MSDILKGLGPHKVFEYFETICGFLMAQEM